MTPNEHPGGRPWSWPTTTRDKEHAMTPDTQPEKVQVYDTIPEWPRGRATMVPMTDRELLAQAQAEAAAEQQVLAQIEQHKLHGHSMAAFALAMWAALDESGLTREERLGMVIAALRGR